MFVSIDTNNYQSFTLNVIKDNLIKIALNMFSSAKQTINVNVSEDDDTVFVLVHKHLVTDIDMYTKINNFVSSLKDFGLVIKFAPSTVYMLY